MYSASGNYTLDTLFYRKEIIEIKKKRFSAVLPKRKSVAFSLLFSEFDPKVFKTGSSGVPPWRSGLLE